jgi:hypothetical protein
MKLVYYIILLALGCSCSQKANEEKDDNLLAKAKAKNFKLTNKLKPLNEIVEPELRSKMYEKIEEIKVHCKNNPFTQKIIKDFCKKWENKNHDELMHMYLSGISEIITGGGTVKKEEERTSLALATDATSTSITSKAQAKLQALIPKTKKAKASVAVGVAGAAFYGVNKVLEGGLESLEPEDGAIMLVAALMLGGATYLGVDELKGTWDLFQGAKTEYSIETTSKAKKVRFSMSVFYAAWGLYLLNDLGNHLVHLIKHPEDGIIYSGLGYSFILAGILSLVILGIATLDIWATENLTSFKIAEIEGRLGKIEGGKEILRTMTILMEDPKTKKIFLDAEIDAFKSFFKDLKDGVNVDDLDGAITKLAVAEAEVKDAEWSMTKTKAAIKKQKSANQDIADKINSKTDTLKEGLGLDKKIIKKLDEDIGKLAKAKAAIKDVELMKTGTPEAKVAQSLEKAEAEAEKAHKLAIKAVGENLTFTNRAKVEAYVEAKLKALESEPIYKAYVEAKLEASKIDELNEKINSSRSQLNKLAPEQKSKEIDKMIKYFPEDERARYKAYVGVELKKATTNTTLNESLLNKILNYLNNPDLGLKSLSELDLEENTKLKLAKEKVLNDFYKRNLTSANIDTYLNTIRDKQGQILITNDDADYKKLKKIKAEIVKVETNISGESDSSKKQLKNKKKLKELKAKEFEESRKLLETLLEGKNADDIDEIYKKVSSSVNPRSLDATRLPEIGDGDFKTQLPYLGTYRKAKGAEKFSEHGKHAEFKVGMSQLGFAGVLIGAGALITAVTGLSSESGVSSVVKKIEQNLIELGELAKTSELYPGNLNITPQ